MTRPAKWFAVAALVVLLFSFVSRLLSSQRSLDLAIHDTYFVILPTRVSLLMAGVLTLFAGVYHFLPLKRQAAACHFWVTTTGIAGFWMSFYLWGYLASEPARRSSSWETGTAVAFVVFTLTVLISPAVLLVNIALAMMSRQTAQR